MHGGVSFCHSPSAAQQRACPAPQPWFHGQTVPHFGNLDSIVRGPAEFVYELNRHPSIGEDTDRSH
jgi:hypothetical protein